MDRAKHIRWLSILPLALVSSLANAGWKDVNMTEGVTEISRQVYSLHMYITWICVFIGVIVFGVMIFSMLMHRKSLGAQPASFHENTKLEIFWTIIPFAFLLAIAWPATTTLRAMYDAGDSDLDIEVRGYQWKWQYTYLEDDSSKEVKFMSSLLTPQAEIQNEAEKGEFYLLDVDNPLVIPINKRVRFLVTSNDVIHSWWVPAFAVKKDAIPGFVHEAWTVVEEPGIYRGQCAELCGKDHGFMPIVVRAVEQSEYDSWLAAQKSSAQAVSATVGKEWSMEELMAKGEEVYGRACVACHQPAGQGVPPAFPSLINSPLILGEISDHANIVINGKPGTLMSAFGAQLDATEIAAVITYERNAWGNNRGDMIQPADINKMLTAGQ